MDNSLIMFYAQWADSAKSALKAADQLEQELKIQVARKEVYNNYTNKMLLEKSFRALISEKCPGDCSYPIFINARTQQVLCGEQSLDALKGWAG